MIPAFLVLITIFLPNLSFGAEAPSPKPLVFDGSILQSAHPIREWLDSLTRSENSKPENALYEFNNETQTWTMNPKNPNLKGMVLPTFRLEKSGNVESPQTQVKTEEWLKAATDNGVLRLALSPLKITPITGKPLKKVILPQQNPKNFLATEFQKLISQFSPPFFAKPSLDFSTRNGVIENESPLGGLKFLVQINPIFSKDPKVSSACNLIKLWLLSRQLVNSNNPRNFQGNLVIECGLLGLKDGETGSVVMYRLPIPIFSGLERTFPLKTSTDTRSVSLLQTLVETSQL